MLLIYININFETSVVVMNFERLYFIGLFYFGASSYSLRGSRVNLKRRIFLYTLAPEASSSFLFMRRQPWNLGKVSLLL